MFVSFFRVIKYAFQNFFRNFWLSFVTLTILFLALASVNVLIILHLFADSAIQSVEDRVDVSIYFKPEIKEAQVLNVQNYILGLEGVKEVTYVSSQDALINFRARHQDDEKIISTLDELDENPLGATLIIKAETTEDYEKIISTLESDQFSDLIEGKDFDDYRLVINKITSVTQRVSNVVLGIAIVFTLISILIIYNTIRIAVYTHRGEIKIMRLVGATNTFIMAPYFWEGIIFSIFSVLLTIVVIYPFLGVIQPYVETFFESGNLNLVDYYNTHFWSIFGWQFFGVVVISLFSAYMAAKKYMRN